MRFFRFCCTFNIYVNKSNKKYKIVHYRFSFKNHAILILFFHLIIRLSSQTYVYKVSSIENIFLMYLPPFSILMQSVVLILFDRAFILLSSARFFLLFIQIITNLPKFYYLTSSKLLPCFIFFLISGNVYFIFQL